MKRTRTVSSKRLAAALAIMAALGTAASAAAFECTADRQSSGRGMLIMLLGTGVVQVDKDNVEYVYVDERYWHRMTFPEKQTFAEDFVCALAGPGRTIRRLEFRSLHSGKALADWRGLTLTPR